MFLVFDTILQIGDTYNNIQSNNHQNLNEVTQLRFFLSTKMLVNGLFEF